MLIELHQVGVECTISAVGVSDWCETGVSCVCAELGFSQRLSVVLTPCDVFMDVMSHE